MRVSGGKGSLKTLDSFFLCVQVFHHAHLQVTVTEKPRPHVSI